MRNWLAQLKMMNLSSNLSMKPSTNMLINLSMRLVLNLLRNKSSSKKMGNLSRIYMLLKS